MLPMKRRLVKIVQWILMVAGAWMLLLFVLAMTTAPFWLRYQLGTAKAGIHRPPDYIVVLGGGGMPSESGLMRCWYAARVADRFSRAMVIVALPGDTADPNSSVNGMKNELILRGVAPERILFEDSGTNTRAEALFVRNLIWKIQNSKFKIQNSKSFNHSITDSVNQPVSQSHSNTSPRHASLLLVTSPEHLYRSVLTFKKAGFLKVDGIPAFEKDMETDLSFRAGLLGGKSYIPDVGENVILRYKFWNYLEYEMEILREYVAIAYYWMMGWI
jgi:uncharacterized SAM-binding protein YcdF (DUF218 family)